MRRARWIHRPIGMMAWMAALVLGGFGAAIQLPVEWLPSIHLPELVVQASWPGASPRQMEGQVTAILEREALKVPGTRRVESRTSLGTTRLRLELEPGRALELYAAELRDRLEALRPTLPRLASFQIERQLPEAFRQSQGFMTIKMVGPLPPEQLYSLADEVVAPRLSSLRGIQRARVSGGRGVELAIELDPGKLASLGIGPGEVYVSLVRARGSQDFGKLDSLPGAPLLLDPGVTSLRELRALTILPAADESRAVVLEDLADIGLRPAPVRQISRIDGQPVVTIQLERAKGSHILALAETVRRSLGVLEQNLPSGTQVLVAEDQSEQVRQELRLLALQGGTGILLVSLLLWVLLKSLRACLFILGNVTVALSAAVLLLRPFGLTLNLITLAGLVLLFGLMADNGLIVTEELLRRRPRSRSWPPRQLELATTRTLSHVALPLVGGTLTTVAVLFPLVYLSGELRALFLPFGILLSLALLASLVSAVVAIPVFFRCCPPRPRETSTAWRRLHRSMDGPLKLASRFPKTTLLILLLLIGTPIADLPQGLGDPPEDASTIRLKLQEWYEAIFSRDQERKIRPLLDRALGGVLRPFQQKVTLGHPMSLEAEPEVLINFQLPQGAPLRELEVLMTQLESTARRVGGIRQIIGLAAENQGFLRVRFTDEALERGQAQRARQALDRTAAQRAGLKLNIQGIERLPFSTGFSTNERSGHRIQATGYNYDHLEELLEGLAEELERHPRIPEAHLAVDANGRHQGQEILLLRWDADAKVRTGLDARAATYLLSPSLEPTHAHLQMDLGDRSKLPVRITMSGQETTHLESFLTSAITVGPDRSILLSEFSPPKRRYEPVTIERSDQQYIRYLAVPFRGPPKLAEKVLGEIVGGYAIPTGYEVTIVGTEPEVSEETGRPLPVLLLGTGAVVFLVLVMVLESWTGPWFVFLGSITGFVGLGIGFLWTGIAFSQGALLGLVLLIGIVVNDGVLLVDRIRFLRQARPGQAPSLLARLAVRQRLRPMWTTTLTTVCGLLPLLVMDVTHEFWTGFAVTVVGGLLSATLLAPFVLVALSALRKHRSA